MHARHQRATQPARHMTTILSSFLAIRALTSVIVVSFLLAILPSTAWGLDPQKEEKRLLTACEKRLCTTILKRAPRKGLLRCNIGKTWGKKKIKKGADKKDLGWSFGDAQCRVKLQLNRRHIIGALTAPKYTIRIPLHTVNCDVETSEGVKPLRATLAPKLKFKNGKVYKVWVKLKNIDGPPGLANLIWTAAHLEDSLGIFHSEIIKEVNKFVHKKCNDNYGPNAKKKRKKKRKKKAPTKKRQTKSKPELKTSKQTIKNTAGEKTPSPSTNKTD